MQERISPSKRGNVVVAGTAVAHRVAAITALSMTVDKLKSPFGRGNQAPGIKAHACPRVETRGRTVVSGW